MPCHRSDAEMSREGRCDGPAALCQALEGLPAASMHEGSPSVAEVWSVVAEGSVVGVRQCRSPGNTAGQSCGANYEKQRIGTHPRWSLTSGHLGVRREPTRVRMDRWLERLVRTTATTVLRT